jgi:hypothetical protein
MNAALPARYAIRAVEGLAVRTVSFRGNGRALKVVATHLAEPLRRQTLSSTTCWRLEQRKAACEGVKSGGLRVAFDDCGGEVNDELAVESAKRKT